MSRAESDASGALSNETMGLKDSLRFEPGLYAVGDNIADAQNDQNSGWFEVVKKKNRSATKSNIHKSSVTNKKSVGPSRKTNTYSGQDDKEEFKNVLSSTEQTKCSTPLNEGSSVQSSDMDKGNGKDNGIVACVEKLPVSLLANKQVQSAEEVAGQQVTVLVDTPKFKWGDLDDEELSPNNLAENKLDYNGTSMPTHHQEGVVTKSEDFTICLEGGKQSSTKELNGVKSEASGRAPADHTLVPNPVCNVHTKNSNAPPASTVADGGQTLSVIKSQKVDHEEGAVDHEQGSPKDSTASATEILIPTSTMAVKHVHLSPIEEQPIILDGEISAGSMVSDTAQEVESAIALEVGDMSDNAGPAMQRGERCVSECQGMEGGRTASKPSIEFTMAASVLMGKFEETNSGESKERFRQRLWCYLFENLNRAIDELYFLCELECDMEQIEEALLVLKEAGMDFGELKSRVEGFEKIKKQPSSLQLMFGGNSGGSFPAKVEHRRPHAIAWEVRRMACSPHRAEILSSSLEAFKKVQQITGQKNLALQPKRREASKLLDVEQGCSELRAKQAFCISPSTDNKEDNSKVQKSQVKGTKWSAPAIDDVFYGIARGLVEQCRGAPSGPSSGPAFSNESTGCATLHIQTINAERGNKSTEKRVSIADNQRDKKTPKTRSSMDAWKVKRNWEDVLSSPLKSINRPSRSPCAGWRSTERVKVLHDKLMSPERKRKSPLEMKKEVDEKQARATRIRRELENERVQRLQKTTEKLNRVSEWQAVRSNKLREGMHARQQRGESRHEAHLAEIARRAGDESSKVSEVRFITSLNEENKKLSLRQKLQDSELRRAERLQIIKTKQKEDIAREEAVLERRRIIEAERLQRLAEAQRKKEEAKARRDEERKAASAAREARAVEQVRKKEVRAKAQQEVTELQAQKLAEKLRESELRRKFYLEQIRERAAMELREQASPSTRLSLSKDGQPRTAGSGESDSSGEKETPNMKQGSGNKGTSVSLPGAQTLKSSKTALQHQALKRRVKKIRQRLMAKKYEFVEPPMGVEGVGLGSMAVAAAARSKVGRWLQDLQRCQLARKAGASGVSFIVAEMIKYFDGKAAELHAARQAGLVDFIATALPASHTSKAEASQTTLSLLRILKVLLSLPANRSYFISRNLLPPLIPILSTALENFSSQDLVSVTASNPVAGSLIGTADKPSNDDKLDALGEVLNGLLECVILVIKHTSTDERQASMQDDLIELLVACEVIHHLRDLFSLFDRPQVEGAPFPAPVLSGLNFLQALTASRRKPVGLSYDAQLSDMLRRREVEGAAIPMGDNGKDCDVSILVPSQVAGTSLEPMESSPSAKRETVDEREYPSRDMSQPLHTSQDEPRAALVSESCDYSERTPEKQTEKGSHISRSLSEPVSIESNASGIEVSKAGDALEKVSDTEQVVDKVEESSTVAITVGDAPEKISDTEQLADKVEESSKMATDLRSIELGIGKAQVRQSSLPLGSSSNFLVAAIAETGLVGLPSLLTAVLLQTNPRSTPEQAAAVLPPNFEEVATCVLNVLNNLARLDLGLVQSLLAMPDLQMEFFHLVSFLLSHCTCKWCSSTDQVASLLLETLLLLGYFALLHPGNQAVLRWGKSPTILHKICDLPFAFFSDPNLMPALVGTLLAVCYGSEQNRDVVREELSMDMLLSLLKTIRTESLASKEEVVENSQVTSCEPTFSTHQSVFTDITTKEIIADGVTGQDEDSIPAKEEIKRMIEDTSGSDSETYPTAQQQGPLRPSHGKSLSTEVSSSPGKRFSKAVSKNGGAAEGDLSGSRAGKGHARVNGLTASTENAASQLRKVRGAGLESSARGGSSMGALTSSKRQPVAGSADNQQATADPPEAVAWLRRDLMLQNRFPPCLLDMAQDFFAAVL